MSERQPMYPGTPKFGTSEAFSSAFAEQVEKPVEFAKGTMSEMPVPKKEQREADVQLAENTRAKNKNLKKKQGALKYKTGEDIAKGLAEAGELIEKQKQDVNHARAEASRQRMMTRFDKRTDKILVQKREVAKSKTPEAKKRHQEFLKRFDERTDEIFLQKNRAWKGLVETYLAGDKKALREELFSLAKTGKILSREILQADARLQKQLRALFAADSKKRTLEDFMAAVPAEQDYVQEEDNDVYESIDVSEDEEEIELDSSDILEDTEEQELTEEDLIPERVAKSSQGAQAADAVGEIENKPDIHRPISMAGADVTSSGRHFRGVKKIDPAGKFESSNLYEVDEEEEKRNKEKLNARLSDRYTPGRSKVIEIDPAYKQEIRSVAKEASSFADQRHAVSEQLAEAAQQIYVDAYRKYDFKAVKDKTDDEIALIKPPFFAFRSAVKNLKNLYEAMVDARKKAIEDIDEDSKRIVKNLAQSDLVQPRTNIAPKLAKASLRSNREDLNEDATIADRAKYVFQIRAKGVRERLAEIREYFAAKNKMTTQEASDFLMGPEIKGLFKGEQKKLQQEYKNLYNNPVHQISIGEKLNPDSPVIKDKYKLLDKYKDTDPALILDERAGAIEKRLTEIEEYFKEKNKLLDYEVHDFLMGSEIKGFAKGKEKSLQAEYKKLYHNPMYQEWAKAK